MKLFLFRHGKTKANERSAYLGCTDEPLSPLGVEELHRWRQSRLPCPSVVYTSNLKRTKQTAAILFPEIVQQEIPAFQEINFGRLEGKNFQELREDSAYRQWVEAGCLTRCPGGEQKSEFQQRVSDGFLQLLRQTPTDPLVLVVHGGTIMALLDAFAKPNTGYFSYHLANGSYYEADLIWEQGLPSIVHLHKQEME